MMERKLRKLVNRKFFLYPKTDMIIEVREELYTIMLDKYHDCLSSGMSQEDSYNNAVEMMADYRAAIKEVETGSSLGALKKNLISTASFSSFYFIALTFIYLFVSMVVLKTFEQTWLIVVGGAFVFLLYSSVIAFQYTRLFNFQTLSRWGIALIFFSLIPLLYVFPSLYISVMHGRSIWSISWPILLFIAFLYILSDYLVYRKRISSVERDLHLLAAGLVLTTILYVFISMWLDLWSIAWIIYVFYLALVSLAYYFSEKMRKI